MAALDFPSSPTAGQIFTGPNGAVWSWDGTKWISATSGNLYSAINNVGRNLIHNPGFVISQRGAGGWSIGNTYTADRWLLNFSAGNDTSTITRNAAVDATRTAIGDEDVAYILSNVFTGSANPAGFAQLVQRIEGVRRLAGKTITVSFWASAAAVVKVGINILRIYGTGGTTGDWAFATGSSVTLSTAWARYSVTFAMPTLAGKTVGTAGDDYNQLTFWFSSGSNNNASSGNIGVQPNGNVSLWGVQLEIGSVATPLEKLDPVTQLQQCQRFYCTGFAYCLGYVSGAGQLFGCTVGFPMTMRAAPIGTITFTGTTYANASGITVGGSTTATGFGVYATGAAAGAANLTSGFTASADL